VIRRHRPHPNFISRSGRSPATIWIDCGQSYGGTANLAAPTPIFDPRAGAIGADAGSEAMRVAACVLVGGLSIAGALLAGAAAAHSTRPWPCRYVGRVAPPGAVICIEVDGKRSLARCEMVLNNPSWRFLDKPCPIASPALPKPIG
jgi:hypothetical protein